ncbi:hypothetical protein [Polynucleobacter sp. UK-Kesae-W10]|uniref:portal protein n=1 Tax=Polynucleobacter sp. UK-Kesae-W10 TaxID=1819738 RepID=UPI001C0BA9D6|nr:hypothetical protein [Polynucleobacter sp. UK-Kesae-W10]MBU3577572.1 hypothetical protein [Polynucleobacter sp. UK-Kesae-W10]
MSNMDQTEYALAATDQLRDAAPTQAMDALGTVLIAEFARAELERRLTEERWLKDLRQYRGQYDPDVLALIGPNRSKSFVRKTRVKVKTVDSRVADLLFPSGSEKNWEIDTTPVPNVSDEQKQLAMNQLQIMAQGQPVPKEAVDAFLLELARQASKGMSKLIDDQLVEARYKDVAVKTIHSGHLYGTGVMKGPLVERKVRTTFVQQGNKWIAKSESYVVPFVDYVPLWRFYPDMNATQLDQCKYVYERHMMTKSDLVELSARKSFNKDKIVNYIKSHPDGEIKLRYYDNELRIIGERTANQANKQNTYEVLERWGWIDGDRLKEVGVKVPEDRVHESFFANVWLLPNGEVIKAVLQPINGVTWPYHMYYFDKDETSIFGEGLSSIMRDDQTMLNSAVRMMLDNSAIASGPMIEVAPSLLSNVDKMDEMYPWKVWLRNSQQPGVPAVRPIPLPSNLNELSSMADRFEANADEVTAIPRYMTGENVSNGAAGTASGMSMLMGAANVVIKDLITSWDEGVTRPFITALYRWNMQFHKDNSIKGDFDVKARGTASLVAKEVRAQQLDAFAAQAANPMDAPFIKRDKLLRQRAEAHELSDVVKTEDEVKQEQNSPQAQTQMQLAQAQAQLALQEAQGKANKLMAEAELAAARSKEVMANIDLLVAEAVNKRVEAVYAALQAGGVATSTPQIAPAGDEILRSSGWQDATPNPSIADLDRQPVQQAGPQGLMPAPANGNTDPERPAMPAQGGPQQAAPAAQAIPATGMQGARQGIETPAND